jgi:hypothetical protein
MPGREDSRREVLREVGRWIRAAARVEEGSWRPVVVEGWDDARWALAGRVAFTQGVAAWLHERLPGTPVADHLPPVLRVALEEHHALTAARARRVLDDLDRILEMAAEADVAVMPLKGSLLTGLGYLDPALRPMADLDLLIRDADRDRMLAAMRRLGYRSAPGFRNPGRDELQDPGGGQVVAWDTEHPDNPCPVELLRRVDKRPWGGRLAYDLTELLWADAEPVTIGGRPAWRPSDRALLIHLAAHATMSLVAGDGRLVQLLDVAAVAPRVSGLGTTPVPRLVHTGLVIAGRLLPGTVPEHLAASLTGAVPWGLRRWSAHVPLDTRAGFADGIPHHERSPRARTWARWRPAPWRLWAGYPDGSLARAWVRHARAATRQRRYRRKYAARTGHLPGAH